MPIPSSHPSKLMCSPEAVSQPWATGKQHGDKLYTGLPLITLWKLQLAPNVAMKVLTDASYSDHIWPLLFPLQSYQFVSKSDSAAGCGLQSPKPLGMDHLPPGVPRRRSCVFHQPWRRHARGQCLWGPLTMELPPM